MLAVRGAGVGGADLVAGATGAGAAVTGIGEGPGLTAAVIRVEVVGVAVGAGAVIRAAGVGDIGSRAGEATEGGFGDQATATAVTPGAGPIQVGNGGSDRVVRRGARAEIGRIGCGEVVLPWWA
jgi:hypothetical protein